MGQFNIKREDLIVGTRIRIDWNYYKGDATIVEINPYEASLKVDNPKLCTSGWTGHKVVFKEHEGFCLALDFNDKGKLDIPSARQFEIIKEAAPKAEASEKVVAKLEDQFYKDLEEEL